MGFKTSYKPTTLRDMIPYLQNIKQRGEETVAACPVCEAEDSNGHHLYIRESGGKLLAYCQKCNAKLPEIIKALGIKPEIIKEEMPEVAEEYDHVYKNPDGTVAYWKHRVKYADGSKDFRFRYVDESGKTIFKKWQRRGLCKGLAGTGGGAATGGNLARVSQKRRCGGLFCPGRRPGETVRIC